MRIFFLLLALTAVCGGYAKENYLGQLSKLSFYKKMLKSCPQWMENQMQRDFPENSITQIQLNATFENLANLPKALNFAFARYRVINGKIYKRFPAVSNKGAISRSKIFDKVLKTLNRLSPLPDLDFIICFMDGIPEAYMSKDFYLTKDPREQAPILSWAKKKNAPYVILIPDVLCFSAWKKLSNRILRYSKKSSWMKKRNMAIWRGASSDKCYTLENYSQKPRYILSKASNDHPELVDAGFNHVYPEKIKELFIEQKLMKKTIRPIDHLPYKYLPVLDGWMCSYPGYVWRLLSNCATFKQDSNEEQWFYNALTPYKHYVPLKDNLSDLMKKLKWAREHDRECRKIAENATRFVKKHLMIEDLYLYLLYVLRKYSGQQAFERKDLQTLDEQWTLIK